MAKRKTLVRWQDGSYDKHLEKCESCDVDHYEPGEDHYKEITGKRYTDWVALLHREGAEMDDPETIHEPVRANPDQLTEDEGVIWAGGEAYPPASLARLEAAVATLTDKQKAVWELVYVQGKTHEFTAQVLNIARTTVTDYAADAMEKVRAFMGVK